MTDVLNTVVDGDALSADNFTDTIKATTLGNGDTLTLGTYTIEPFMIFIDGNMSVEERYG